MKSYKFIMLITFQTSLLLSLFGDAAGQPSKATHPIDKSKAVDVKGIDTFKSKESDDKTSRTTVAGTALTLE